MVDQTSDVVEVTVTDEDVAQAAGGVSTSIGRPNCF